MNFDDFFAALWPEIREQPPAFPWQRELARRVLAEGKWPASLDLPTSAGKTAVLDIAVWSLAHCEQTSRMSPRRIFFVVDRRIVVDEAAERARLIRDRLSAATDGILRDAADRLRALSSTGVPLEVSVMRGGMPRETAWVSSPAQPAMILTTVDQLGSRLLFRGYGVTPEMAPIHAGLAGTDSLVFLDEAHLSAAFRETLEAIRRFSGTKWRSKEVARPIEVVSMSATLGQPAGFVFRETYTDGEQPSAELRRRLEAHKQTHLVEVPTGTEPPKSASAGEKRKWLRGERGRRATLVAKLAALAQESFNEARVRVVGVVVNRVASAREVFQRLDEARRTGRCDADLLLLTGRCRPLDRDRLLRRFWSRLRAGRARTDSDARLIVVATQCIEAGANLDFDSIVTEIASLDALRQRFGRLDRFGELENTTARIVARTDHVHRNASADLIYGSALKTTWKALHDSLPNAKKKKPQAELPLIDFGIKWLKLPGGEELTDCLAPRKHAPVLLSAHLDLFCQTSPRPHPDPDVAAYLHGPASDTADVSVVWRADLDAAHENDWAEIVSLIPPSSAEAMPVPLSAVRAWLAESRPADDLADVEGIPVAVGGDRSSRKALLWLGTHSLAASKAEDEIADRSGTRLITANELFPGCTVIVPASYGGADDFGWSPLAQRVVFDHGDTACSRQLGRPALRLSAPVFQSWIGDAALIDSGVLKRLTALVLTETDEDSDDEDSVDRALTMLRLLSAQSALPDAQRELAIELLAAPDKLRTQAYPGGHGLVVIGPRRTTPAPVRLDEGNDSSFGARGPITLEAHTEKVFQQVVGFTTQCPLATDALRGDLKLAAKLHDLGKCDRRFQTLLRQGDRVAAATGPVLAKSATRPASANERRRARERAGVPVGWRHELLTLSLLEDGSNLDGSNLASHPLSAAVDRDLVQHLITSHHGYCRAIAPIIEDPAPPSAKLDWNGQRLASDAAYVWSRLDSGITDRFWGLVRRYGWFGLAYLEAVLRLADHRASAQECQTS